MNDLAISNSTVNNILNMPGNWSNWSPDVSIPDFEIDTRGQHSSDAAMQKRCRYLHHLDPKERCNFVNNSRCDELSELILYHYFMFCKIPNPTFVDPIFISAIVLMTLWMFFIFLVLGMVADEFFCPALGVMAKLLNLSENLAGVTLLAFGNSVPDLLASISTAGNASGSTILMYNELLGSSMFVTGVVAGLIAYMRPFTVQPFPFLRDQFFLLFSIIWVRLTTIDEKITLREAISYIVIYVIYLTIVIVGFIFQSRVKKFVKVDDDEKVNWEELGVKSSSSTIDEQSTAATSRATAPTSEPTETESQCREFWQHIKPIDRATWNEMSCCGKFLTSFQIIPLLLLKLFIPVVNLSDEKHGWCKLLNTLHCLLFPTFFVIVWKLYDQTVSNITIFVITFPVGFISALIVFFTSVRDKPPVYHGFFAILGFTGAMCTIYFLVNEVVAMLALFGTLLSVKMGTLALTVLAWGNSIGDAIANISIAKQGFQRMAFAGCYGAPLNNNLLSMGITCLIRILGHSNMDTQIRGGVMGPICTTFLMINLAYSIIFVVLTKFQARRSYGAFLLLVYLQFAIFCLVCEIGWVHPLGSDHEFDTDLYNIDSWPTIGKR